MKDKQNFFRIVFLIHVFVFYSSCEFLSPRAPYIISIPKMEIGGYEDYYKYAGIECSFYNTSSKTIEKMEIDFSLFDPITKKPLSMSGPHFSVVCRETIDPGEEIDLRISLDFFIHYIPDSPFLIDNFSVRRIYYTDKTTWEDPFGIFAVSNYGD